MPTDTQGEGGGVTLRSFLAELATDRAKLVAYMADPDACMSQAGVSEEQQQVLKSGNLGRLYARMTSEQQGGAETPALVVVVDVDKLQGYAQAAKNPVPVQPYYPPMYPAIYPPAMLLQQLLAWLMGSPAAMWPAAGAAAWAGAPWASAGQYAWQAPAAARTLTEGEAGAEGGGEEGVARRREAGVPPMAPTFAPVFALVPTWTLAPTFATPPGPPWWVPGPPMGITSSAIQPLWWR